MHSLELCLYLPEHGSQLTVSASMGKTLLYVHEYPPDAHRGYDVPATRVFAWPASDVVLRQEARSRCHRDVAALMDQAWALRATGAQLPGTLAGSMPLEVCLSLLLCSNPTNGQMCVCVCYNIENVKEQHQGDADRQSIKRVRKHP